MPPKAQAPRGAGKANLKIPTSKPYLSKVWVIYAMLSAFGIFYLNHQFHRTVDENLPPNKLLNQVEKESNSAPIGVQQNLGQAANSSEVSIAKNVPQHPGPEMVKTRQGWTQPKIDYRDVGRQRALESYMRGAEFDIGRRQEEATRRWHQEVYRLQQVEEFKRQIAPPSSIQPPIPPPAVGDPRLMRYR